MIISYCTQCGKRNDISVWPPSAQQPIDVCTCSPEPHVTILPPSGSTVINYNTEDKLREMVRKMVAEALRQIERGETEDGGFDGEVPGD